MKNINNKHSYNKTFEIRLSIFIIILETLQILIQLSKNLKSQKV